MREVFLRGKGAEALSGLVCKALDEKCLPEINKLIARSYPNNQFREIFRITNEDTGNSDVELATKYLKSKASWGVFEKQTDRLVALRMNTAHSKADREPPHDIPANTSQRNAVRLRFLNQFFGDMFNELNTACYMRGRYSCTSPEYRSRGLAGAFEDVTNELARARGCEYFVAILGSVYLQQAAKSEGYTVLREVKLADYVDPETGLKPDLQLSSSLRSIQLAYRKF